MTPTVAHLFPARRQPDGTIWYRSGKAANDGWSSNIEYADPSYRAPDAPPAIEIDSDPWISNHDLDAAAEVAPDAPASPETAEQAPAGPTTPTTNQETAMTALDDSFEEMPRLTQWQRYPLPPELDRPKIKFNGWGWYQVPNPETGRTAGYPRATTISDTLEDQHGLSKWKRRETVKRIMSLTAMPPNTQLHPLYETTAADALQQIREAMEAPKVGVLDNTLEIIDNLMGGADARELGECAHAWLAAIHAGQVLMRDVPEVVRPHVEHGRRVLAHRGLIVLPEYTERIVMNEAAVNADDPDAEIICGQIDGIARCVTTGELILLDVKTSRSLEYSWLGFAVQVGGAYGWATKMLALDGKGWEPMPETNQEFAVLLHIPSAEPAKAQAITIDKWWGGSVMAESLTTRQRRKEAKDGKEIASKHAIPMPSKEALRYVQARNLLSEIGSAEDGQAVYESFQDVWDDDLGEFGAKVAELL